MKLDLLTNATVVDDAIKFVAGHSNSNSNSNGNKKNWKHTKSSDDDKEKVVDDFETESETEESRLWLIRYFDPRKLIFHNYLLLK